MVFQEYISVFVWQDLGLSLRASRALFRAKVVDLSHLRKMDYDSLRSIRGIGETTAGEIYKFLLYHAK